MQLDHLEIYVTEENQFTIQGERRPRRFDQMGPNLLEQVPPLRGRKRLDQLLFGRSQNFLEADHEEITEQVGVWMSLGPGPRTMVAQGSWATGGSASALPFLLGDELKQDLVSSSRSTMTSGGASIPKRMRPFAACTTVTRMDSLMRMLSPTFRERTSMIDPSMMSMAATGPSMTLVGCNCRLPVGLFPCCCWECGHSTEA